MEFAKSPSLEALIALLGDASAYPSDAEGVAAARSVPVEVVQTHASVVFLVGDRAWKIKKPVDLGFLDFSTLERRKADCEREVILNRRMAPDLYLGVWPVVRGPSGALRVVRERSAVRDAEALEWAVEMRRLPSGGMLDRVIARGEIRPAQLLRFADDLARFHARAERSESITAFGAPEVVARRVRSNLERLVETATHPFGGLPPALPQSFVDALALRTMQWLEELAPVLAERQAAGRVCDGHGDLHARNLCIVDDAIVAYDCLEFEPAYRCADVAMEVAFLAMDLDRLGHHALAELFVDRYIETSGDRGLRTPWRFFRLHYAIVRSMVEAIRLSEPETPADERAGIRGLVRSYAELAAGYAVEPATVVMMGVPGSGKSTYAKALAVPFRATVIRSDEIRRLVEAESRGDAGDAAGRPRTYDAASIDRVYRAMADAASRAEGNVILDATHLRRYHRGWSCEIAERRGPWCVVETIVPEAERARRITERSSDPANVSDATVEVARELARGRDAPDEVPSARYVAFREPTTREDSVLDVSERLLRQCVAGGSGSSGSRRPSERRT